MGSQAAENVVLPISQPADLAFTDPSSEEVVVLVVEAPDDDES